MYEIKGGFDMLKKIKELYEELNYVYSIRDHNGFKYGTLSFQENSKTINIIVTYISDLSCNDTVLDMVNNLYEVAEIHNCYSLHTITEVVPDDSVMADMQCLNIKITDLSYLDELKDCIKENEFHIELLPHNYYTYLEAKALISKYNKTAIVQSTGTGKSYIIGKFISDNKLKRKVVLTPSTYIIKQLIKYFGKDMLKDTTFMTYKKLSLSSPEELEKYKFDIIILDEFHRAGAEKWEEGINNLLANNKQSTIIGTTATPKRYLDNNRNMVEELFDGISTKEIDLSEAIIRKILPTPKYVYSVFNFEEEVNNMLKIIESSSMSDSQREKKYWISALNKIKLDWSGSNGLNDVIKAYLSENGLNKFIVFCSNKKQLTELKLTFKEAFKCNGFDVEQSFTIFTGSPDKNKHLNDFERSKISKANGVHLLFCIDMLSEGIHLKSKDGGTPLAGVFLMRPTVSPIIFYQQIGRALASDIDYTPFIFDLSNNCANIKCQFYMSSLESKGSAVNKIRSKYSLEPISISDNIDYRCIEVLSLFEEIRDRLEPSWESRISQLEEFISQHGHCCIQRENSSDNLLRWAQYMRTLYNRGQLESQRVKELNELGFVWDVTEYKWSRNLNGLTKFADEKGNIATISREALNRNYKICNI